MTIIEAYELLKNRIGWKQPPGDSFVVDPDNLITDSGRYFQDEHTSITLNNIHATIDIVDATNPQLNEVLADLRRQAVIHTVSNVFDSTNVRIPDNKVAAFDTAISLRMAMIVIGIIVNSTRSNLTERLLKNSQLWFYELNGGVGNERFPKLTGIKDKYSEEIRRLKDMFNQGRTFDTYTLSIGDAEEDPALL